MQIREINPTGRGKQLQFHASTLITTAPDEHVRNLLGCYRPSGSLPVPFGRVFVPVVLDRAILWERYTKRQNSWPKNREEKGGSFWPMIRTRPKISFDEPIYKNLKRNWAPRKRANLVQGKKKANPIGLSVQVTTVAGKNLNSWRSKGFKKRNIKPTCVKSSKSLCQIMLLDATWSNKKDKK